MTESKNANAPITGTLRSLDGKGIVRMERHYDTDVDDLWQALTDRRRPDETHHSGTRHSH